MVFLIIFLFLQNFRATFIPTIVIPVALLGTFAVMYALGFSINVLTMFGMVLAVGELVDDAIVVVENVERIMSEEGLDPREATIKAMKQITGALIGISLVLTAVFIPMAFFGGSVGAIYRQFSLAMISCMLFSIFLAMSLTPALCATLLKPVEKAIICGSRDFSLAVWGFADGNVDANAKCANPDCGHLASSHLDDDAGGDNTGACQMTNCECMGFQADADVNNGTGGSGDNGVDNGGATSPSAATAATAVAPPPDAAPTPAGGDPAASKTDLNEPPEMAMGDSAGAAFTIPVAVIEGQDTGDGRTISPMGLTWRTPPIPLMLLLTETHDPEGWDLNDPAVWCGGIESLTRSAGEGGTQIVSATGHFLPTEDGLLAASLVEAMGRAGISADIATLQEAVTIDEDGLPDGFDPLWDIPPTTYTLLEGEILGRRSCRTRRSRARTSFWVTGRGMCRRRRRSRRRSRSRPRP